MIRRVFRASSLLAFTALLAVPPLAAQGPSPNDPLPVDPAVTIGTLENGLRFYIRENSRPEERAELRLVVNAGAVMEEDDQNGLAHLVEHMAFNGTANFEKQELVNYLESIGMEFGPSINAFTGQDETVYMLRVPTDDPEIVATAFQILEDWAHQLTFDPEEIDKERGVVIEEWRGGRGASARMRDKQFPVLFKDSRYAERLVIGTREILETFPHEALIRFYRDWYRPDLMAVVAVGDFDGAVVEGLIRQHFSRIPAHPNPRPRQVFPVPPHDETLFAIATDPEATDNQVAVLYKQPSRETSTVGAYRQLLVETLYNSMLSNRFFELSREPEPPFAFAGSGQGRMVRSAEIYQLFALVQEGGIARGMESLLTEAERVARHGFTASELDREKADFLRSMESAYAERENQESASYASEYMNHFLVEEPIPGIDFEYGAAQYFVPGITLDEVNQVARVWLVDENRVVMVNAPEKEGLAVPSAGELGAIFGAVDASEIEPYLDTSTEAPLLPVEPSPSPVVREEVAEELGLTEWELANGVRVLLKPTDFKDDEILFRAYSPGGYSLSELDEHLSATFASSVVGSGGVGEFNLVDLQKKLAGKAVGVAPAIGELTEGLSGSASPKDVETMFQLIYLYFTAPRRDEAALATFKSQMTAFLANRSASPMAAFSDTISVTMAQGHPRARPITAEALGEIDMDEAFDFYTDRFADASDFTFVLVGAFELAGLRPLVEKYLGGLPSIGREESWRDLGIDPPTGVIEKSVRKGLEPQSQTAIVFTGPFDYTADNRVEMRALASVLDIRLREILREDLGGTYGVQVYGSYEKYPDSEYTFTIVFGSDPDRVDELVGEIFREIDRLKVEGPTVEDVDKVKETERRSRETNLEENRWWVAQLAFADEYGSDPRFLVDPAFLETVTVESIQEGARQYLSTENFVRVSLFPETN
jgi:zinc protease